MSNNSSVSLVREVLSFTAALKIKSCRKRFCFLFHRQKKICFGIYFMALWEKRERMLMVCARKYDK